MTRKLHMIQFYNGKVVDHPLSPDFPPRQILWSSRKDKEAKLILYPGNGTEILNSRMCLSMIKSY